MTRFSRYQYFCALMFSGPLMIHPAYAQSTNAQAGQSRGQYPFSSDNMVMDETFVVLGMGVALRPDYEGADEYKVSPAPLIRGRVAGFDFTTNGTGLSVDLIKDKPGQRVNFNLGPSASLRFGRNKKAEDPVIATLGARKTAFELGGSAGISVNKVLHDHDSIKLAIDMNFDVSGIHDGVIFRPSLSYSTPLSRATYASLSLSASYADAGFMDTYFSVNLADSIASGLPAYKANAGWKNASVSLLIGHDLSGDARDGGWGLFTVASYSRLLEDARRSPIVALRGSSDQFFAATGVAYVF